MPVNLKKPLAWSTAAGAERQLLDSLQGNILKGHGRDRTANVFFALDPARAVEARAWLSALASTRLSSAFDQLKAAEARARTGADGGTFLHLALTHAGYAAIGRPDASPDHAPFREGMKARGPDLADAGPDTWERPFQDEAHGLIIVADDRRPRVAKIARALAREIVSIGGRVITVQQGGALRGAEGTPFGEGIEHFGYVDGISQPLVLAEDIAKHAPSRTKWDPSAPLDIALVPDPGAADGTSFGSFLVFRKLEQDVQGFKTREQVVAETLAPLDPTMDRELAGALLVGRFEDGTPVAASAKALAQVPPPNDFSYGPGSELRCPVHAHIRKTNPRGSGGGEPLAAERRHLMLRRGIPYTDVPRRRSPFKLPESESFAEFLDTVYPLLPKGGVGLLFMAYNSDLADQFEFTQRLWANNAGFPFAPNGPHGIDPVIGQGANAFGDQKLPVAWGDAGKGFREALPFSGFVTLRGGAYLFAPSLTFLRSLARPPA